MKSTMKSTLLLATLLGLAALMILLPGAQAEPCSMASGAGTFGFTINGVLITPTGPLPVAAVGQFSADAAGTLSGTETRSLGGAIADETFTGTFSVNPDCTAKYTFEVFQAGTLVRTTKADVVFVNHQQEAMATFTSVVLANGTSLPPVLSATTKRISRGDGE